MGDIIQITSNIEALSSENPIEFLEACESLVDKKDSVIFKEILFPKLAYIIPHLIKKSEMSPMQGLLSFYLFEEKNADSKFMSLEQNDFETDFELNYKNSRYYASSLIYVLCKKFKGIFLNLFVPLIWANCFLSQLWSQNEAGIYLFHHLNVFIADHPVDHFEPIINSLLNTMDSHQIDYKIPAITTLIKYIEQCTYMSHSQFFKPFLESVFHFLYDDNRAVQNQGCRAILKLDLHFHVKLKTYVVPLNHYVTKAFRLTNSTRPLCLVRNLVTELSEDA